MRGLHQRLEGRSAAMLDLASDHSWLCHLLFHVTAGVCLRDSAVGLRRWFHILVCSPPLCLQMPVSRYVGLFLQSYLAVQQFRPSAELTESLFVLRSAHCWHKHVSASVMGLVLHDGTCHVYQNQSFIFCFYGRQKVVFGSHDLGVIKGCPYSGWGRVIVLHTLKRCAHFIDGSGHHCGCRQTTGEEASVISQLDSSKLAIGFVRFWRNAPCTQSISVRMPKVAPWF